MGGHPIDRGRKGQRLGAPVGSQKNHEDIRRAPWQPELIRWLEWRIDQQTDSQRLSGEASALFWYPQAHDREKAWNYTSARRVWADECKATGEKIAMQAGLRHSVLSRLAEVMTPDQLKVQSQHKSLQSLAHDTVGAQPNHAAMVRAITQEKKSDG